jgi:flagellar FliL protein
LADVTGGVLATQAKVARGRKLLVLGIPVVAALAAFGLFHSGVAGHRTQAPAPASAALTEAPIYADLPDIVANLDAPSRRPSFIKLKAKLELAQPSDVASVAAGMPRLLDLFQTYLRDIRPEELRGSAGTYRLREELVARANIALSPAHVTDVLFVQMIVQ